VSRWAVVAVVCGLVSATSSLPPVAHADPGTMQGSAVASALQAGEPLFLHDKTISGRVRFTPGTAVRAAFGCKRCKIQGGLSAQGVTFERRLDLSGSTIRRKVDLEGAVFLGPVRFGVQTEAIPNALGSDTDTCDRADEHASAVFGSFVILARATFQDLADFENVTFCKPANLTGTRFRASARFGNAKFHGTARFRAAQFDRGAVFARDQFDRAPDFQAVTFGGVADFRRAALGAPTAGTKGCSVCFADAVFRERADFTGAYFNAPADFSEAVFAADAIFREATFSPVLPPCVGSVSASSPSNSSANDSTSSSSIPPSVSFDHATITGRLDLDDAVVKGCSVQLLNLTAGTLSLNLNDPELDPHFVLNADRTSVGELLAKQSKLLEFVDKENRIELLRRLESSARSHGNLRLANDAHFRLQQLAAEADWPPQRFADWAIYNNVAGYLVRPFRPLEWLVGIVLLATCIRALRLRQGSESSKTVRVELPPGTTRTDRDVSIFPRRYVGTFATAFWLTLSGRRELSPLRAAEILVYGVLIACILVGLANSNPTLRDMIDAIR
jgi:uncharacterized protein YjbI with pentapeptide repeats